jgi:DNA-binding PadR family transcriptional regulator
MALSQAILAVLVQSPTTGYDLAKKFDGSVGFFWKATHQQIYRELAKLEEQGWVENEVITQPGKPEKKVYRVTDLGIEELQTWMQQPTSMSPPKEDILVKMFAGYLVPPETILAQLETHRQLHQERLSIYEFLAEKYFAKPEEMRKDEKFVYLTLRNGLMYERYWIDWCQEAIASLYEI